MITRIHHNNPYLLVPGTADPQVDGNGDPIPDPLFGTVEEIETPDPPAAPVLLSATAFNKYAASKLAGGGAAGMARFMQIMDAGRTLTGTAAAFAVTQYDKALTFEKSEVEAFGAVLSAAECMTEAEVAAIVDDWPER